MGWDGKEMGWNECLMAAAYLGLVCPSGLGDLWGFRIG